MKKSMKTQFLLLVAALAVGCGAPKELPNGGIWPDDSGVHVNAHGGGILKQGDTYYWYGQFIIEGELGNTAQVGVSCYSSKDLLNWKNEGIALAVSEDPESDIAKGSIIERPKVIYNARTGKYVMWFHLELLGNGYKSARCGIAVSDTPTGPFTYLRSMRPNAGHYALNATPYHKRNDNYPPAQRFTGGVLPSPIDQGNMNIHGRDMAGGQMSRDMNLFVDTDGSAYLIHASEENSTLHISRLTDDYLDTDSLYVRLFPERFHEAPAMFKRGGKYYMITSDCTGWAPNAARSMCADEILGEWRELGNPCVGEDADLTFHGQSTYVLQVGEGDAARYIFMADRWTPENAIDGRYLWLPISFEGERPVIRWQDTFCGLK